MPILSIDPFGLFTVDQSCDTRCNPVAGPGKSGGEGPNLSDVINKEGESACAALASQITDPNLRECIRFACIIGQVFCKDCNQKDMAGSAPLKYVPNWEFKINICKDTWKDQPDFFPPGEVGDTVIHEFAHTCGWPNCGGYGVPDNRRESGRCDVSW